MSNRIKRIAAPRTWDIQRKEKKFVIKPSPGPHPISLSYPLGVVIRDVLKLTRNSIETRYVLRNGKVYVDWRVRREASFPVGLFDVVSIPEEQLNFRVVPSKKGLSLVRIESNESKLKLCKIVRKNMVKGARIQYGTHDGRSILDGKLNLSNGDSVLIELPTQNVLQTVKLDKEVSCVIISGERAGQLGKITEIKKGTMTREKMVKVALKEGETEIPERLVFPVGKERPLISVGVS